MKKRDYYYELMRIFAMFLVIGAHSLGSIVVYAEGSFQTAFAYALNILTGMGPQLFFALSGCFILRKVPENILEWYKRHYIKLLVPFMIYGVGYVLYFKGIEERNPAGIPLGYVESFFTTGFHGTHWFIYAIFGLYFAAPFLAKLFKELSDNEAAILLVGILGADLFIWIFSLFGWEYGYAYLFFNGSRIKVFILGYLAWRLSEQWIPEKLLKWRFPLVILFFILQILITNGFTTDTLIFLLLIPHKCKHTPVEKLVSLATETSYYVYLVHAAVISLVLKIFTNWGGPLFPVKIVLIQFVVWVISLVIVLLTRFVPDKAVQVLNKKLCK